MRTQIKISAVCGVLAVALVQTSSASNLIVNGGFEVNGGNGQVGFNTTATGWTVTSAHGDGSYAFLYAPGTGDTTGANGQYGNLSFWGPGNGTPNGFTATSPSGGYFLASDADFQDSLISQTVTGLTVGKKYAVSFYWAAGQQQGFDGEQSEGWDVTLGAETHSTGLVSNPNHGFRPWRKQSLTFTATSASEVLTFLADGSPQVPPFSLLDGVSMQSVPDSNSTALFLGASLVALIVAPRLRRQH